MFLGKTTLHVEEANQLFRDHYTYGWILQAYLFTLRTCPQTRDWNEFVDLGLNYYLMCSRIDLTKITWVVWSLNNYIPYIDTTQFSIKNGF